MKEKSKGRAGKRCKKSKRRKKGREVEKEQVKCVEGARQEGEEGKEKKKGETEREIYRLVKNHVERRWRKVEERPGTSQ